MKFFISIFVFSLSFTLNSCEDRQETPDWNADHSSAKTQVETGIPLPTISPQGFNAEQNKKQLRFVSYNIRNYLTMRRGKTEKFKPENEISALINNIVRAKPDILGICEIGTKKDLDHLRGRLKNAGIHFQHSYLSLGADPYRRQALLSHFPIQKHDVPKYTFQMKGKAHEIRRGILDATINTPKGKLRFLGAHLKSKRPIAFYDQAEIRREEAQILRKHASVVMADPTQKVILFGDMNDTKGSSAVRLLRGPKGKKLTVIELYDKHGTKWTQYWAKEDIYSRFDYIFVSKALLSSVNKKKSFILDTPPGDPASDHRALVIIID